MQKNIYHGVPWSFMLLKMLLPFSYALSKLFEQKGHHVRLSVSQLLNCGSKLLTLYLL